MPNPFLEERISAKILAGLSYADDFAVDVVTTASQQESRRLVQPYPVRRFTIQYADLTEIIWAEVLALYYRVWGKFAGFRVRCDDDYSTAADHISPPSATDQQLEVITAGELYRLQKVYGAGGTALSIGRPVRTLFKPVAGTVKVAINNGITGNQELAAANYTVDTTTGRITMAANNAKAVTAITQAASAVVTVGAGHGYTVGRSVYFSGIGGMTQLNGRRGAVIAVAANTITVAINTTGFSAYTSGGTVNTRPQTGETVLGGCEFDVPCRFDTAIDINRPSWNLAETEEIELIELINP